MAISRRKEHLQPTPMHTHTTHSLAPPQCPFQTTIVSSSSTFSLPAKEVMKKLPEAYMSRYRSAKLVSFDPVIRRTCMNNNVRKRNPSDMAENMKTLAPVNNNGKRKDNNSPPQAIVPGFLSTKYSQFHGNPCYPPPSDLFQPLGIAYLSLGPLPHALLW
ncbi:hypothetical protein M9H77_28079 [Catharanthus roseus]|uniref:Uncharacterized protein n=1 Tax=Catharanthus roseus TaxID=4058 RepID=A0ACC0AFC4_CATRO|nr:hypothetical protein M9H77_28079 [Catharanthus roseus]